MRGIKKQFYILKAVGEDFPGLAVACATTLEPSQTLMIIKAISDGSAWDENSPDSMPALTTFVSHSICISK
jgi:hypothetical protein